MYQVLVTLQPTRKSHYHQYISNAFKLTNSLLLASKCSFHQLGRPKHTVFLPDCTIAGIQHCIQRRPPGKWRKGQLSPLLLQGCMQALLRHSILIPIPRLKIATDMGANELIIYNATNISFLPTKNSGLVAIIVTSFLYLEDRNISYICISYVQNMNLIKTQISEQPERLISSRTKKENLLTVIYAHLTFFQKTILKDLRF